MLISRILPEEVLAVARAQARVDVHTGDRPLSKPELIARLQGQQGLVCQITDTVDDEVLAACPELRVVSNVAVGYNNIDVAAATRRGVLVTNTPRHRSGSRISSRDSSVKELSCSNAAPCWRASHS